MAKGLSRKGMYRAQGALKIRTASSLQGSNLRVGRQYVENRRENCVGVLTNWVDGYDGDAWYVQHKHGVAAYKLEEMEAVRLTLAELITGKRTYLE